MKVSIYVVAKQAKPTYATESYNVRKWPGLAVIKDTLSRAGIAVGYCSLADVHEQDVVLVSITSACDWWPYIAERTLWRPGPYRTICGGAGVLNIRPFLSHADIFVFGRAESYVADLVRETANGHHYDHPSVAYADSFSATHVYHIAQAEGAYPYLVQLEDGTPWQETAVGCQHRCLFCGYTWQRANCAGRHDDNTGATTSDLWSGHLERTMLDLDIEHPDNWEDKHHKLRITAIDGFSERLRRRVNKPISRDLLRAFFLGLATLPNPHQLKIYNLVGLPGESREDWHEFLSDLSTVDDGLPEDRQWSLVLHCTPFRAMPATPAAHWPMAQQNFRGEICRELRSPGHKGNIFFQGHRFWAVEGMGTDSLATHALDAIALRGVESDAAMVTKIAGCHRFWAASAPRRLATLQAHFDLDRLFGPYTKRSLPTSYLRSWWDGQQGVSPLRVAG